MAKLYYGIGLNFGLSTRGFFSTVADKKLVNDNLTQILLTNPGERVHNPDFGVGLERYLFEQNDAAMKDILVNRIFQQVQTYLPIVNIINIRLDQIDNQMLIKLVYNIKDMSAAQEVLEIKRDIQR
jgi:phage baseplate assembly protein W